MRLSLIHILSERKMAVRVKINNAETKRKKVDLIFRLEGNETVEQRILHPGENLSLIHI